MSLYISYYKRYPPINNGALFPCPLSSFHVSNLGNRNILPVANSECDIKKDRRCMPLNLESIHHKSSRPLFSGNLFYRWDSGRSRDHVARLIKIIWIQRPFPSSRRTCGIVTCCDFVVRHIPMHVNPIPPPPIECLRGRMRVLIFSGKVYYRGRLPGKGAFLFKNKMIT